jgi:hypothetical protein
MKDLINDVKNLLKIWKIITKNGQKCFYFIWPMLSTHVVYIWAYGSAPAKFQQSQCIFTWTNSPGYSNPYISVSS